MPKRIAKTLPRYAGKALTPGEEFECEAKDIHLLVHIGLIEPKKGEPGYVPHVEPDTRGMKSKHKAAA